MLKSKKILVVLLLATMFISCTQPIFAFTNSESGKWVAGQYDSGIKTTDSKGKTGVIIRRLTNYTTKEKITVFCAEFGVDSSTGEIQSAQHIIPTDPLMKNACKIAYFGWYSRYGEYAVDGGILTEGFKQVKLDYVFTQQMIWEVLNQSHATFIDSKIQQQYNLFKNQINSNINNMQTKPSFCNTTITLDIGQTITLTDTNNVLAEYTNINKNINGIQITHNKGENTMTISVSDDCTLENYSITEQTMENWGVIKETSKNNNTTIFFSFKDGVQNQLYSMHYNEPVSMSMNFQINQFGIIELSKLDKNGKLIDGAIFEINGPDNYSKSITVANGKIILDKLKKGIYTIKEKIAPEGYLIDTKVYQVEVVPNQITKQTITNEKPTGTFTLIKKNADETVAIEGTKYRIWNNNGYDKEYTTDKEGKIIITGLELGNYNYKEIQSAKGYLLDTNTYSFELTYKDSITSVIYANAERINTEPTGIISIIKKDSENGSTLHGDATLENAIYTVYASEDIYDASKTKKFYSKGDVVATCITNEKGETEAVRDLPLGKYLVKEEKAPIGYMIDPTEYEVNLLYKDHHTQIITENVISIDKVKLMQVHIYKSGIKENSGLVPGIQGAEFTIKLNSDVEKAYNQGYSYSEVWNGIDESGNIVNVNKERVLEAQKIAPTYDVIITDKNGNAYTSNKLPYGKYVVKETKTPQDFECSVDFTFTITQDETEITDLAQKVKHLVVNNEQLESYIKIIKKDTLTDKKITLNSTTFEIKATQDIYDRGTGKIMYKKGETIKQNVGSITYSTFTTNADNIVIPDKSYNSPNDEKGSVTTPLLLPVGSYEIIEIKAPDGFLKLEQGIAFEIENIKEFDKTPDGKCIKEIIIKNEKPTATLIINKNIKSKENVNVFINDIKDLSGIQFLLSAKEDIIDMADGSIIYQKGKEINIYNTDKAGKLKIENLPLGTYELKELKTLEGVILDETQYEVNFKQKDQTTKIYVEEKEITNYTAILEKPKIDEKPEEPIIENIIQTGNERNYVLLISNIIISLSGIFLISKYKFKSYKKIQ